MNGKHYKMTVSSPKTRTRWYAYYATLTKLDGKDLNIPCEQVNPLIPAWLQGIAVEQDKIPSIRQVYQSEVLKFTHEDKEAQTQKFKTKLAQLREEEARLGRLFIMGKISEETYEQLRREWQEKLHDIEEKLSEVERNARSLMVDLDLALILVSNLPILFDRLDQNKQATLLKIIAKRIIINSDGQIVDQELHSPFTYLLRIADGLENQGIPYRCSEQIRSGVLVENARLSRVFCLSRLGFHAPLKGDC